MPPHRKDTSDTGTGSTVNGRGGRPRRAGNSLLTVRALPSGLQRDLDTILQRREALERKLADIDERVYDLESEYLRACVELGGSLFDGYGVERASFLSSGTSFLYGSPTSTAGLGTGGGGGRGVTTPVGYTNFPGSPCTTSGAPSVFTAAMSSVGSHPTTESSAMAFRARTQNFTPSERIFSAASVGAIERVAQAKAMRAAMGAHPLISGGGGGGSRSRRGASGTAGCVINHDGNSSIMTRRRRRHTEEDEEGDENQDTARALLTTRGGSRRRSRGE